jgi:alpha-beta hydrolase superfamily lysophospholipase/2-polyprenyl-3-methyl-5-hydroxy-6-metoxy-1,4-benzoquinol methylase
MHKQKRTAVMFEVKEDFIEVDDQKKIYVCKRLVDGAADYTLVLLHGTAGHGGCYGEFADHLAERGVNVYTFDFTGHGRTTGPRGIFSFQNFLDDTRLVTDLAARETGLPVVVHGASQGGEVAFHALDYCDNVVGGVCMNILLNNELPLNRGVRFLRSGFARWLGRVFGDQIKLPLLKLINFKAAYQEDPGLLAEKAKDPLYVWRYGLKSYLSVFNYRPAIAAHENSKPILITVGEEDEVVSESHCQACFEVVGGPKNMLSIPGGGHQLMLFEKKTYARLIDSWIRSRVLAKQRSWEPEFLDDERRYFEFLKKQVALDQCGEEGYHYSLLDKLLVKITNGTIDRGVRYFSNTDTSKQWAFTEKLVSKIDYCAWDFLKDYVPENSGRRLAVLGCGSGEAIAGLLERQPRFHDWEIVGIDVDYNAIDRARQRFASQENIRFIVGDAEDEDVVVAEYYNVIHMHGIFDHCGNHRALLANLYRGLKEGGRLFYVTPDRNIATWLTFVYVGPLYVFKMYKSIHDYRRFPRPSELNAMLRGIGYKLVNKIDRDELAVVGLDYKKLNPFAVAKAVKRQDIDDVEYVHGKPKKWLKGFMGEYVGVAEK